MNTDETEETFETFEARTSIPDAPIRISQRESFTADVAGRMGRVFQRRDVVVYMDICVAGLTANGPYEDFLQYLSTTTKLQHLILCGRGQSESAVSSAPVIHRILTVVSTSTSIRRLGLHNTEVTLPCLWKQPFLSELHLIDCAIAPTGVFSLDNVDMDELQSSMEIVLLYSFTENDATLSTNTLNLFLEISKVHSKVEIIDFLGMNKRIVLERIIDILQGQTYVPGLCLFEMGTELSWYEQFIIKLNSVSNTTIGTVEIKMCWNPDRILQLENSSESERGKVINAMNRSSSIVHIQACVDNEHMVQVQSVFNQQEEEKIRRIGNRNGELAKLSEFCFEDSLPQGLWPHIVELATQSGHPDHIALIDRIIRTHLGLNSTFFDETGDVIMGGN